VGKISNIARAVGRADLVLIAAHDMLPSTNSPWNYQGPFWLPVIDWGYDLKQGYEYGCRYASTLILSFVIA
jgi:hypothetical protein